jgi:RNA polymerase primary sigma factor
MQAISGTVSLDHPARDGDQRELEGILRQESAEVPDTNLSKQHLTRKISHVLSMLPSTEQAILRLRFGLDDDNPLTLREIGERLGLSRERVRQLETSALRKVRESPASRDLALYLN